jgi:hypothetical protein
MRKLFAAVLLTGALVLAGCSTASPTPTPTPTTSAPVAGLITPISVTRFGGIAGQHQSVSIQADGAWSFTDSKTGQTSHGQLTAAQARALEATLTDPALTKALAYSSPTAIVACADGFEYMLQFSAIDTFTFFDCGQMDPALTAVITALKADTPF